MELEIGFGVGDDGLTSLWDQDSGVVRLQPVVQKKHSVVRTTVGRPVDVAGRKMAATGQSGTIVTYFADCVYGTLS